MTSKARIVFYWIFAFLFSIPECHALLSLSDDSHAMVQKSCSLPSVFYTSKCPFEMDLSLALDDFRSLPDGSWNGNWGGYAAVHLKAFPTPYFSTQLSGSYGIYDWAGRAFAPFSNSQAVQQQGLITLAASRQVSCYGLNIGVAYDWMLNKRLGLFAVDPAFDQIRGQIGYLIRGGNEIGIWAAYGIHTSHEKSQQIPLEFRGISQVNLFWCHYFKNKGYGMLWAGTPYRRGLMYESGRPGNFIFGVQFSVPLTHHLSVEGHGSYMVPRGSSGLTPAKNYASNISIGLTYAFGKRRIQQSPYMTLANNSNFFVDTNQNF